MWELIKKNSRYLRGLPACLYSRDFNRLLRVAKQIEWSSPTPTPTPTPAERYGSGLPTRKIPSAPECPQRGAVFRDAGHFAQRKLLA